MANEAVANPRGSSVLEVKGGKPFKESSITTLRFVSLFPGLMPETGLSELEVVNEFKFLLYTEKTPLEDTKTIYICTKEYERNVFQKIILAIF